MPNDDDDDDDGYLVKIMYQDAPQHAIAPTPLLPPPSQAQIPSAAPYSQATLGLCSSPNVMDQVSHPYKTKKTVVLYISICTFFDSKLRRQKILHRMMTSTPHVQSALKVFIRGPLIC